jgi:hypothetical protein
MHMWSSQHKTASVINCSGLRGLLRAGVTRRSSLEWIVLVVPLCAVAAAAAQAEGSHRCDVTVDGRSKASDAAPTNPESPAARQHKCCLEWAMTFNGGLVTPSSYLPVNLILC